MQTLITGANANLCECITHTHIPAHIHIKSHNAFSVAIFYIRYVRVLVCQLASRCLLCSSLKFHWKFSFAYCNYNTHTYAHMVTPTSALEPSFQIALNLTVRLQLLMCCSSTNTQALTHILSRKSAPCHHSIMSVLHIKCHQRYACNNNNIE